MADESSRRRPMNVGGASLFSVLVILCLMVFAVLARLSALSERSLAEKASESIACYYDAEYRASVRLAEIKNQPELYGAGEVITYTEEIDRNRELHVTIVITEDGIDCTEWASVNKNTVENENEQESDGLSVLIFEEE